MTKKNGDMFLEVIQIANGDREKEKEGLIKLFFSTDDEDLKWFCALGCLLIATKGNNG